MVPISLVKPGQSAAAQTTAGRLEGILGANFAGCPRL